MDIETRLRKLEARYRAASLSADAAKAHCLALAGEGSAPPAALERAQVQWKEFDLHKRAIAAQLGELEELDITNG
jgi:hypothetical protein